MYNDYDLNRLRAFLPQYVEGITRKSTGSRDMYICPLCGSGTGPNKTAAFRLYRNTDSWFCFSCQRESDKNHGGDIFELIRQYEGIEGFNDQVQRAAELAGIHVEHEKTGTEAAQNRRNAAESAQARKDKAQGEKTAGTPQMTEAQPDYTDYYVKCAERITDPAAADYLKSRGISLQTAKKYMIGYDPAADPANNPGGSGNSFYPAKRLIIPMSKKCYVARVTNPNQVTYKKLFSRGSAGIDLFNTKCLYAQEVQNVFITEGAFDALSVIECGRQAIALNSVSNAEKLLKILEDKPTKATLLICLDNDGAGRKTTEVLSSGLQRLNISYLSANISGAYKDPNDFLTADRAEFEKAIEAAERNAGHKPDNTATYIETLMQLEIDRFRKDKKTGFPELDRKAGGLYSGLYVLAAISSLGKTTFAHQLAEQLAENGSDVLYFSLEQSRLELVSKSLTRRIAAADPFTRIDSLSIRKGGNREAAAKATRDYIAAVSDRLSIIEGNFNCNVDYISKYVRQYVSKNNVRPVVFIDYLQILQPPAGAERQGTKETIDTTVTELKRLSRELDLTIFVISSVNRANYLTPIDFESLKESGIIEFTSDVIFGLQLQVLNDDLFNSEKKIKEKREKVKQAKAENPRKIELLCLKNRYGISNYSVNFSYYPAIDLFKEESDFRPDTEESGNPFTDARKFKQRKS